MSLFCQLGFEGALSFLENGWSPAIMCTWNSSIQKNMQKKMQSFMDRVICCAQNIRNLELSLIVEEMFQNAFHIAL